MKTIMLYSVNDIATGVATLDDNGDLVVLASADGDREMYDDYLKMGLSPMQALDRLAGTYGYLKVLGETADSSDD